MPIHEQVNANPKAERFRRIRELLTRHGRTKAERFLVEGPQAVRELVRYAPEAVSDVYVTVNSAEPDAAFISPVVGSLAGQAMQARLYVHKVTREVADHISTDCQGVFAVAYTDAFERWQRGQEIGDKPFVAAFWQVRDPGNAGTVIRSADAAGCDAVIFVDDCVDMLNPKVIRSTTGSLFHIPVLTMSEGDMLAWADAHGCRTAAADVYGTPDHQPMPLPQYMRVHNTDGSVVLFGNEARGLTIPVLERMDDIVSIPMYGKAESLNLAMSASIALMSMAMSSHVETM